MQKPLCTHLYVSAEGMGWISRCLMAGATQLSPNVTTSAAPVCSDVQDRHVTNLIRRFDRTQLSPKQQQHQSHNSHCACLLA
jgi:hypothetical protein